MVFQRTRGIAYSVMESSSVESDLQNFHKERKLYAVDSLNNLNEQNLCADRYRHNAVSEENLHSQRCLTFQNSMRCQNWFFVTLIITLIVSLALVSFVIILIVHTGDKMDEVSRKIVLEKKSIDDLKELNDMILQHLNQTEWMGSLGNFSTKQAREPDTDY